jgi:hypothetical protein
LLAGIAFFSACRPEEEFTTDPSVKLEFSVDTVYFDTVFTQMGGGAPRPISVTKQWFLQLIALLIVMM